MRRPGAGHRGAVGNKHRCHDCGHPGGVRRRVDAHKKPCSCTCHHQEATVKPIPIDTTLTDSGVDAAFEVTTKGAEGHE